MPRANARYRQQLAGHDNMPMRTKHKGSKRGRIISIRSTLLTARKLHPTASTTLEDSFEASWEGSPAMGTSIRRRAGENGEHGAPDRGQRRLGRPLADSFFPRSPRRGGGFAGRRRRSSS